MIPAVRLVDPVPPAPLGLVLLGLLILGASVWIGGMAAVTVLARVSSRTLEPAARVRLFRDFGRSYLAVAGTALVVTAVCGLILLIARGWDGLATAIVVVVAALIVALAAGVRQARAMRRLRQGGEQAGQAGEQAGTQSGEQAGAPGRSASGPAVTAAARRAAALRSLIGLLSAAAFVLAICTAR